MFKLNAKFDEYSLLYSVSHFECDGYTVHRLTQQRLPPPLTSTVKSSLFTHEHSSPLSFSVRLHQCCAHQSCYINYGWAFSGQNSSYIIYSKLSSVFSGLMAVYLKSSFDVKYINIEIKEYNYI